MGGADEENSGDEKNEKKDEEKESDRVYRKPLRKRLDFEDSSMDMLALTVSALDQPGTSSDAVADPTPIRSILSNSPPSYDFDLAELEPQFKKIRIWAEEKLSLEPPKAPSPPRLPLPLRPVFHGDYEDFSLFNPFPSTGSGVSRSHEPKKKLPFRIKSNRSELPDPIPQPKLLLGPHRNTYLRPRPENRPLVYTSDGDPNAPMHPPTSRYRRTPHETVKKAMAYLKRELGIILVDRPDPNQNPDQDPAALEHLPDYVVLQMRADAPPRPLPDYSLDDRVHVLLTVAEVISELDAYVDSLPDWISSEGMKGSLLEFQKRLELPEWPLIYNVIWQSPIEFLHLLEREYIYDGDGGGEGVGSSHNGGGEGGSDGGGEAELVDFSKLNPFSSSGSDLNRSQVAEKKLPVIRFKLKPESKLRGFLGPKQNTYLRPRPANYRPPEVDPNAPMGQPGIRILMTPHAMVKHRLKYMKKVLGIFTDEPDPNSDPPPTSSLTWYSLKDRVHPFLSIEDVIIELDKFMDSTPNTTSSGVLMAQLSVFQKRLNLPESPLIYNVIWDSAMKFVKLLKQHDFHYRNAEDEWVEMGNVGCSDGGGGGSDGQGGSDGKDHQWSEGEGSGSDGGGSGSDGEGSMERLGVS